MGKEQRVHRHRGVLIVLLLFGVMVVLLRSAVNEPSLPSTGRYYKASLYCDCSVGGYDKLYEPCVQYTRGASCSGYCEVSILVDSIGQYVRPGMPFDPVPPFHRKIVTRECQRPFHPALF